MKKTLPLLVALTSTSLFAGFDFNTCSGSGTFEQEIVHYGGDYENAATVGEIPQGIQGLKINLISDKDVDIRLYADNGDKIVHWPNGILNSYKLETKPYQNVNVTYSGFNGVDGNFGHEFIQIDDSTPTAFTMKAFGYKAGYATVNYSWTGKEGCAPSTSGTGTFQQEILNKATNLVGTIPPNVENVEINLTSENDLDIQLYAQDGTAIARWKPAGLMAGPTQQSITYHNMKITWSGYNGVNNQKGHEYITIEGNTSEMLVMKVYGYQAGTADVVYRWGDTASAEPVVVTMSKLIYTETVPNPIVSVDIVGELSGDQDWVGVYHVEDNNDWANVVSWNWAHNGKVDLSKILKNMPAGDYEVRLFFHNEYGANATVKGVAKFTVATDATYGIAGTHPIAYHDEVDTNMTRVYYPTDIPNGEKVPVVFFASGYGSSDASDYESLLRFVASHGYYVIYAKHAWNNVFANMDKMLDNANGILPKIDTTRIGVMGHSLGGGYTFNILKHFSDMGYGDNGRFVMVLEGYYAYNLTENEMKNLPSNTNVVMQQYGVGGNNAVNDTDPRITLTEYYMLDSIPANQKDWQIVENADHYYPKGNKPYAQMQGILKPLDALMEYTFKGTPSARTVALEQGSDDPYHHGNGIQVVNARSDYGTKCDYDANVLMDYCDMAQWYYKKQLILNQKGAWAPMMPNNFASRAAYINTLPFSGFTMVGNSYTNRVMESNTPLLPYSYIWNEVKDVKDLYPTKSNFLMVDMHFPADFWDDAVWNNVIANFQTLAKVANDLGFRGIVYDDEAYDLESHKMMNYKHGNAWYDDDAYKNPNHTFAEHSAKITARFKQIMQAMITVYPAIDVLYYHSPVEGHIEADNGIEGHPVVVNVGLERQHEWIGAMFLGFKQGLSHQASLHDMGEDYRLRTQKHFDDAYTWRKHTIASDATNAVVDATTHWIVPMTDRADWAEKVHVNFLLSNEPLASEAYPEFDTTNSVGLNDMKTTLERALDKSDKYVTFYSASSSDDKGGRIQLDWLNDPTTHTNDGSAYGLDPLWKNMVEEVYSTQVLK